MPAKPPLEPSDIDNVFNVIDLLEATLALPKVPVPDKVNVSEPTKLLNVRSELLALVVPS